MKRQEAAASKASIGTKCRNRRASRCGKGRGLISRMIVIFG